MIIKTAQNFIRREGTVFWHLEKHCFGNYSETYCGVNLIGEKAKTLERGTLICMDCVLNKLKS